MANMDLKKRIDAWNRQEKMRRGADRVLIYPSVYDGAIFRLDLRFPPNIYKIGEDEWENFVASVNRVSWGSAVITTAQREFRQGVLTICLATCGSYQEGHVILLLDFLAQELFNRQYDKHFNPPIPTT